MKKDLVLSLRQCYWAALDGNDTLTWADAHLTPTGVEQARAVNDFWAKEIIEQHIPAPQSYYVSPLDRCLSTANETFSTLPLPNDRPFKPTVKELLREGIGIHTCDRRSSKSYISDTYPTYTIEPGLVADDPLWVADLRESASAHTVRLKKLLDDIFIHDSNTFISMTSHGGSIAAILRVIGHRDFPLRTGAALPVFVKAEVVSGKPPSANVEPWTPKPTCNSNDHPHDTPNR